MVSLFPRFFLVNYQITMVLIRRFEFGTSTSHQVVEWYLRELERILKRDENQTLHYEKDLKTLRKSRSWISYDIVDARNLAPPGIYKPWK